MASREGETSNEAPKMEPHIPISKYTKRVLVKSLLERNDGGFGLLGEKVVVGGWVKSSKEVTKQSSPLHESQKEQKGVSCNEILQNTMPIFRKFMWMFGRSDKQRVCESSVAERVKHPVVTSVILQISDGSCVPSFQVVVDSSLAPPGQVMLTGTCILVEGVIQQPCASKKHTIELKAEKVLHLGVVQDHDKYPLSKKKLPLHSLRDWAHFRPRTTTVASITRIRHSLTHATHDFFQNNGFLHVQVPIITTTDSEGFSNKFNVTTLLNKTMNTSSTYATDLNDTVDGVSLESIKTSIKEKSNLIDELKRTDSNREALVAAIQDLKKTNELASQLEAKKKQKAKEKEKAMTDTHKFLDDYFSCQAFLTVSGRLHLESYACALGNVYSFGPRFNADAFESSRHVSEMWMVEAEMAFAELEEAMSCASDLLKHICKWVLEHAAEDMKFMQKRVDQSIVSHLQSVISSDVEKISYCQAIDVLKEVKERKFEFQSEWGIPLTQQHESYLADVIYKKTVIIYDYPKEVKPFYVRQNEDGKTVAAFDVIMPKVGAVIRGSQNEERANMLAIRIKELGLSSDQYEWYMNLRRHGTVKHAGFSLAFDHMVLLATGISDIQDVIPFPRSFGKAKF